MSTEISPRHAEARRLAALGIPVFPCVVGGKAPACEHGFHDATTDLGQIDAWWAAADYNLAFEPHAVGQSIVDLDGIVGADNWEEAQIENGYAPRTKTVATPNGTHLYFKGELPPTVSKIAFHVDTRGINSYALLPPSVVNGKEYQYADDSEPVPVPEWISVKASASREHVSGREDVAFDHPASLARAEALLRGYVARGYVAVEGQNGDNRTYSVCCEVMNLGLTPSKALELIETIWNPACVPPWYRDELSVKIENASRYAQNGDGAWAVESAQEAFGAALDKLPDQPERSPRNPFYLLDESEQEALSDPQWLFPQMMPDQGVTMLFGPQGSYKSFLALDMGLTLAAGIEGWGKGPTEPMPVIYIAAEGAREMARKRRPAWKLARSIQGSIPFYLVEKIPFLAVSESVDQLLEAIKSRALGQPPKLIVVDTLARAMTAMNENDARDAGIAIEAIARIQREFRCAVLVIHHAGKDEGRGARGSSAFMAGVDAALEVKVHKPTKAVEVFCRRQKDADEREAPWTFQGKVVGPSLVFFETSAQEHRLLVATEDIFEPKKIGKALSELNAYGPEAGVTTTVLAFHITPHDPSQSVEQHSELANKTARGLRALSRNKLEAYCEKQGHELLWFIPSRDTP